MNDCSFALAGASLVATASGALIWPDQNLLCVSDLHLGKSERIARRGGALLPPYEGADTLERLEADIARHAPRTVICLGDSFDDSAAAAAIDPAIAGWLTRLRAGRRWVWIAGNHDPVPTGLGGEAAETCRIGPLTFRHIARRTAPEPGEAEVSGHYHPKARLSLRGKRISRPCLLTDGRRAILPAFGTYTGGLDWTAAPLMALLPGRTCAILTGRHAYAVARPPCPSAQPPAQGAGAA